MPITVDTGLPLSDKREGWDGDAAKSRLASHCGGVDSLDDDCMGKAFLWKDPDAEPGTVGAYKFPVADVVGGRLQLSWPAVAAAANALSGGRGGTTIPEADQSKMKSKVATLYNRFADKFDDDSIEVPWDKSGTAAIDPPVEAPASDVVSDDAVVAQIGQPQVPPAEGEQAPACTCGNGEKSISVPLTESGVKKVTIDMITPADTPASPVIQASAADGSAWTPPREHFSDPGMTEPVKMKMEPDGRIYGHLATWKQHHISASGEKIYAPKDPDGLYRAFRQSTINTTDGPVAVGLLSMDTGHADLGLDARPAVSHYDNTGTMVAAVNVGEDDIGIWFSGSVLPSLNDDQRTRLDLARVSGDWRQVRKNGNLELVAALVVNTPGFPVMQGDDALDDGRRFALAASAFQYSPSGTVVSFTAPVASYVGDQPVSVIAAGAFIGERGNDAEAIAQMVVDKLDARKRAEAEAVVAAARMERAVAAAGVLGDWRKRDRAKKAYRALAAAGKRG